MRYPSELKKHSEITGTTIIDLIGIEHTIKALQAKLLLAIDNADGHMVRVEWVLDKNDVGSLYWSVYSGYESQFRVHTDWRESTEFRPLPITDLLFQQLVSIALKDRCLHLAKALLIDDDFKTAAQRAAVNKAREQLFYTKDMLELLFAWLECSDNEAEKLFLLNQLARFSERNTSKLKAFRSNLCQMLFMYLVIHKPVANVVGDVVYFNRDISKPGYAFVANALLMFAASVNDTEAVVQLMRAEAETGLATPCMIDGSSALHNAIIARRNEGEVIINDALRGIIALSIPTVRTALSKEDYTPLMLAAIGADIPAMEMLLWCPDVKANINTCNKAGNSAMHLTKDLAAVSALIAAGANPFQLNNAGVAPIHTALSAGGTRVALVDAMMKSPDSHKHIDKQTGNGLSLLAQATIAGDVDMMSALLASGANPFLVSEKNGQSPLHHSSQHENPAGLSLLLTHTDSRPHIEAKDNHGNTPLLLAMQLGRTSNASLLAQQGASLKANNLEGKSVAYLRRQSEAMNHALEGIKVQYTPHVPLVVGIAVSDKTDDRVDLETTKDILRYCLLRQTVEDSEWTIGCPLAMLGIFSRLELVSRASSESELEAIIADRDTIPRTVKDSRVPKNVPIVTDITVERMMRRSSLDVPVELSGIANVKHILSGFGSLFSATGEAATRERRSIVSEESRRSLRVMGGAGGAGSCPPP